MASSLKMLPKLFIIIYMIFCLHTANGTDDLPLYHPTGATPTKVSIAEATTASTTTHKSPGVGNHIADDQEVFEAGDFVDDYDDKDIRDFDDNRPIESSVDILREELHSQLPSAISSIETLGKRVDNMHALTQMLLGEVTALRIAAAKSKSTKGGAMASNDDMKQGDDSATVRAKIAELETTVVHLIDRVDKQERSSKWTAYQMTAGESTNNVTSRLEQLDTKVTKITEQLSHYGQQMVHQYMTVAKLSKQYKSLAKGLKSVEAKMTDFDGRLKKIGDTDVDSEARRPVDDGERSNEGTLDDMQSLYGHVIDGLVDRVNELNKTMPTEKSARTAATTAVIPRPRSHHMIDALKLAHVEQFSYMQNISSRVNELHSEVLSMKKMLNQRTGESSIANERSTTAVLLQRWLTVDAKIDAQSQKIAKLAFRTSSLGDNIESAKSSITLMSSTVEKMSTSFDMTTSRLDDVSESNKWLSGNVNRLNSQLPSTCDPLAVNGTLIRLPAGNALVHCRSSVGLDNTVGLNTDEPTKDSTTWTTIQYRSSDAVDFNRSWSDYVHGFGDVSMGGYWLGLEHVHELGEVELAIEVWDVFDEYRVLTVEDFHVGDAGDGYKMEFGDEFKGNLSSSSLEAHRGAKFSTHDVDHDESETHCARYYAAGWWFASCHKANLNGNYFVGMLWYEEEIGEWLHLRKTRMSVRRK